MRFGMMITTMGLIGCIEVDETTRIELTCEDYCDRIVVCDDETDVMQCNTDCVDAANNCQNDELDSSLEELDECSMESCDDIGRCSLGAGLECYLGI